ncbi:MAG: hypothetical protein Kapaf2KO_07640 [Candidatus Kapaibacteriales bacterium]
MKLFTLIALSLTSLAVVIPAETIAKEGKKFHKHGGDQNARIQHFIDDIDLDESQKKSIKNLNEQYRLKAKEFKNDQSRSREERKYALKELRDEKRDNLD